MSQLNKIPLYGADGRILAKIDPAVAIKDSPFFSVVWSRKAVNRNRPQHPVRAYLTCDPGFLKHVVEALCGGHRSSRYGIARQQQLATGHVWTLAGTHGSKDVDIA